MKTAVLPLFLADWTFQEVGTDLVLLTEKHQLLIQNARPGKVWSLEYDDWIMTLDGESYFLPCPKRVILRDNVLTVAILWMLNPPSD